MAYAVSVWFDEETDRRVRGLWRGMADAGVSRFLHDGPFRPHLTLAICDDVDVAAVSVGLASLARERAALAVPLASVGVFPGAEAAVVFLAATRTPDLSALHEKVHLLLARHGSGPTPYYLPDRWNPHCTVARAVPPELVPRAVAVTLAHFTGWAARAERVALIETPAEVESGDWPLRAAERAEDAEE